MAIFQYEWWITEVGFHCPLARIAANNDTVDTGITSHTIVIIIITTISTVNDQEKR